MELTSSFSDRHAELVSDIAFDYYGERIATCSGDHCVNVWELSRPDTWQIRSTIQGRTGVFQCVCWAHPEFGQILAACSSDCNVVIYEEIVNGSREECPWIERSRLVDSHGEVKALEFAPRHLGLQLATFGEDGIVRIYEAVDIMQLSVWPLRDEFSAGKGSSASFASLSWNTSQFDPPQLVVGRLDSAQIWQYSSELRRWHSMCELVQGSPSRGLACVSPTIIIDLAWAPNLARSYDLIALCFTDQPAKVFKISHASSPFEILPCAVLPIHACRLSWNLTGTTLATSSSNGTVQLWSKGFDGQWMASKTLRVD